MAKFGIRNRFEPLKKWQAKLSPIMKDDDRDPPPHPEAQARLIEEVATLFEGQIRDQFIAAINQMTSAVELQKLTDALESGNYDEISEAVGLPAYEVAMSELNNVMMNAFSEGGHKMSLLISSGKADAGPMKIGFAFDRTNPAAVKAARTISGSLTSRVQADTADAIQQIIQDQVRTGVNPAVSARKIKQIVGLNAQQAQALANYEKALTTGKLGAAKGYSITATDQKTLEASMTAGKPLPADKIAKLVDNYRKRLIAQRASTIAKTESMSAVASGAHEAWIQGIEQSDLPTENFKRFWIATNDSRTRPDHVAIPHMNSDGVGVYEPFQYPGGTIMRPHDPEAPKKETINCRCCQVVRYVPPTMIAPLPVFAGTSILPGA